MEATDILQQEHRVIERVLNALEAGVKNLEAGENVDASFFLDAVDFFKGFADGCHHKKEEGVLFIRMADFGIPVENGPLGVMLTEHEMGRQHIRAIQKAAEAWGAGNKSAQEDLLIHSRNYIDLLREHILKEDRVLFPIADRVIPQQNQADILHGFEHVEHEETGEGIHEKYLSLAESLEKRSFVLFLD
jgi:hemerythrin-like domain-containing protein